jgi:hypothetical protein
MSFGAARLVLSGVLALVSDLVKLFVLMLAAAAAWQRQTHHMESLIYETI